MMRTECSRCWHGLLTFDYAARLNTRPVDVTAFELFAQGPSYPMRSQSLAATKPAKRENNTVGNAQRVNSNYIAVCTGAASRVVQFPELAAFPRRRTTTCNCTPACMCTYICILNNIAAEQPQGSRVSIHPSRARAKQEENGSAHTHTCALATHSLIARNTRLQLCGFVCG
jgi:hypothetical protein